jgi:dipeptidyl aminopeptidase/acylaminoacyl peptidase
VLQHSLSLALASVIAAGPAFASPGLSTLTYEDLASVPQLGGPELSPDGKQFALVRDGQIVLAPADGGWPTTLTTTVGGKSDLVWSPDGTTIAFVSAGSIWTVSAGGGSPTRLTDGRGGGGDPRSAADRQPAWSPNGQWILYESGRRGNSDLLLISRDGLTSQFLISTDADEGAAAWSPDGATIAYVERSPAHFSGRLLLADVDQVDGRVRGTPRERLVAPADRGGGWSIGRPTWSPDSSQLALVLQDSGWDHVYLLPVKDGPPRAITRGAFEAGSPVFSPDGGSIAVASNEANLEERHIWIVPAAGGHAKRLTSPTVGVESAPQWSPDGRQLYFTRSTPLEPAGLFVTAVAGSDLARGVIRTRVLNFERAGLKAPVEVQFKSRDGLEISALLYSPATSSSGGTKPPAILWIHGGPESQDVLSFDPWALFLAEQGYVVLEPNYRGSSGYGERFRNLNVEDSGGGELDDVVAGAQYLVDKGLADPARIGIGGGSHGGTMVAYAITKHPALFKAALELYGVTDRASYNERTNRNAAIRWMRKMGGTPLEKPEVYRKANILPDVPKITAPVLVMHGEDDPQVPPYESAQFVAALKKAGKSYVYVTYPKEGHGFSQHDHRLDAWAKQVAFLNRYLQPEYGQSITSTQDIVLDHK